MDGIDGDTAQNSEGKMIRTHLFFELCNEDKDHVLVRLRNVSCDVSDHYIKTFFFVSCINYFVPYW